MEGEFCLDNFDLSPICGIGTPQSQQDTPQNNLRYPVKLNLKNNPITLTVKKSNDYGLQNDQGPSEGKFKVIKYNSNIDGQQNNVRDFSENFTSKRIPVEKNFVRINYLKTKEKEVKTIEDLIGGSTISTISQSNHEKSILGAQSQKKVQSSKANLSKSISKTTIVDSQQKKQPQSFKKRSSISNSTKIAPPSARSISKKGQDTPSKNNSFSERKSNKKSFNNTLSKKSPHKLMKNNSSSSCCSCCKSQGSPMSSVEKHMILPSEGVQCSVYNSISQRAQSVNSKKSNQSGLRSSFNIHFDLSSEWNHKSSILSSTGQNKTSEYLSKKIQQIFERKQEKQQIKQIQNAEKIIRNELYGMFSRQSREMKQKKLQELSMYEQMQKQIISTVDPEKIERVDCLIRQSIEKYSIQKKIEQEEKDQQENQKKLLIQKVREYDTKIKQNNYILSERRSKSRENSQKKEIQYKPWGIDQRKFDQKPKEEDQQKVKVVRKDKIDIKNLFSQNETVNQLVRQIKIEQKKKNEELLAQQIKQGKHSQSSNDIRQEKKIDKQNFDKKVEERFLKIIEEKKQKARELKSKKSELSEKLNRIENERKESLSKCRMVPFKPSKELIEKAFNNLQQEDTQENQQQVVQLMQNENIEPNTSNRKNENTIGKTKVKRHQKQQN